MTEHKDRKRREFAARLRKAADYRGLPEHGKAVQISEEFNRRGIKMTPVSVGRWFHAVTLPASTNMQILAELLNVQADWLISGRGPMVLTEARDAQGEIRKVIVNELPLLEQAQVRAFLAGDIDPPRSVVVAGSLSQKAFCYRLTNQRLAPKIASGTLLVVDPHQQITENLPAMALDGDSVLFGYPVRDQGAVLLEPVNPQYPLQTVTAEAVIGPVVALAQQFLADPA